MKTYAVYTLLALLHLCNGLVFSQERPVPLKQLDSLIAADAYEEAQALIVDLYETPGDKINKGKLVYPLAKTEFFQDKETQFPRAQALVSEINASVVPDTVRYEALLGKGLAHVDQGSMTLAREQVTEAHAVARRIGDPERLLESEYHLGEIGLKLGEFGELIQRTDNALRLVQKHPERRFRLTPRVYNYKGALMHFMAQPDSAEFYFQKAVAHIDKSSADPEIRYYLPATINGNWMLVKQSAGDYDAAMELTLESISLFNQFLENTNNHPLTEKVQGNLSIGYRNLGSLYNDLGFKDKAIQVATLGYNHAKRNFLPQTVQYFSAILMKGEAHLYAEDLQHARTYLEEARASLEQVDGENWSYQANLYFTLGDLEKKTGNFPEAISYYEQALNAYEAGNPGEFNQNIIFARINLAQSLASDDQFGKAADLLDSTQREVVIAYGKNSYLYDMVQLTRLRVGYNQGIHNHVIRLGQELLRAFEVRTGEGRIPYHWSERAEVLSYLVRSSLAMNRENLENSEQLVAYVESAIGLLERARPMITSAEGVSSMIASNNSVFNAAKLLYLRLYEETGDKHYLQQLLILHESSVYNRIRARLNLASPILLPKDLHQQEQELKEGINSVYEVDTGEGVDVVRYDSLMVVWEDHLNMLEMKFPRYYRLRYASLVDRSRSITSNISPGTTLVRFLALEDATYAIVLKPEEMELVKLGSYDGECLTKSANFHSGEEEVLPCLYDLYQALWQPLEQYVATENLIIFPDGDLFNLSFELLSPKRVEEFRELKEHSLLSQYNIAYNYSLMVHGEAQEMIGYDKNFIAFVPEFDDSMKNRYKLAISDSVYMDRTYLTLLPQPFSKELVRKYSRKFRGNSFLNEKASKQLFIDRAREHKIIHIGTHAESNNVNPELSRLVFAKNMSDSLSVNDNYLYSYEIYDQNLSAELAILTACETGRPTYQPGEGMISLAHAFNYAGSRSVLTSLWQIDEKSSAEILGYFYDYLASGASKDEALRKAKLDYLANGSGRTLHPQYWAGLVLMGDPAPVHLSAGYSWLGWALGGLLLLLVTFWLMRRRSRSVTR